MKINVSSLEDLNEFAKKFSQDLRGGELILLYGDLGSGKTAFVKCLGKSLGLTRDPWSPTFTLLNIYPLKKNKGKLALMAHMDCYRIKNIGELEEIGIGDFLFSPDTLTLIEWPEILEKKLPKNKKILRLKFSHPKTSKNPNKRIIILKQ